MHTSHAPRHVCMCVCVFMSPQAVCAHPWWEGGRRLLFKRFYGWSCGDVELIHLYPQHTFYMWPSGDCPGHARTDTRTRTHRGCVTKLAPTLSHSIVGMRVCECRSRALLGVSGSHHPVHCSLGPDTHRTHGPVHQPDCQW